MPGFTDGWQVLQTLRSSEIMTPIIMLTAKDQVDDRVTYQNSPIPLPGNVADFFLSNKAATYTKKWKDGDSYFLASSFYVNDKTTLVVGLNIDHHIEFFAATNTLIFWFTLIVSVLAGLYSIVIVNSGLRPLKKFERYLSRI